MDVFWDGMMAVGLVVDELDGVAARVVVGELLRERVEGDEENNRFPGDYDESGLACTAGCFSGFG